MIRTANYWLLSAAILLAIAPISGCGKFFVDGTATETVVSASTETATSGESLTLTGTVTPTAATGSVTFYDNGVSLGSGAITTGGVATLATTSVTATGANTITAVYSGDSTYATSTSAAITITVSAAS